MFHIKHNLKIKNWLKRLNILHIVCLFLIIAIALNFVLNIKSDIDGIMDYLAEANHDILVGFNEANRLKVEEIQGDLAPFKKFWAFLSKKV